MPGRWIWHQLGKSRRPAVALARGGADNGGMARFTLRQLLVFVTVGCVYFFAVRRLVVNHNEFHSVLGSARDGDVGAVNEISASWRPAATQLGAWLILSVLYRHWRMTPVIFCYAWGFTVALFFAVPVTDGGETLKVVVVLGCMLGTLVSLPLAVFLIFARAVEKL